MGSGSLADLKRVAKSSAAKMTLSFSKMKKAVEQNNMKERVDEEAEIAMFTSSSGGLKHRGLVDTGINNAPPKKTTSSRRSASGVASNINYRLPRVSLAARLENELMVLWNTKHAWYFYVPVDTDALPNYRDIVRQPICLTEIRAKIANYEYETAQAMYEDVALMARNADMFNGPKHQITITANKLLAKLRASLDHDRNLLGDEKDAIRLMEEAIVKKNAILNSTLRSRAAATDFSSSSTII